MNDRMRWRFGETFPVHVEPSAEAEIAIGDLVCLVDARAVAACCCEVTALASSFLGVAMQRSRPGESAPIRVATAGVFEFDCAPRCWSLGDLAGPLAERGTNRCANQVLRRVEEVGLAVGVAARVAAEPAAQVLVDLRSAIMRRGVAP
ncbi:MAG: hypothetical protein ACOY3P_26645 [Planctomycetota bacterium]